MEIDKQSSSSSDLRVPSGFEVEAASLGIPSTPTSFDEVKQLPSAGTGLRDRLEHLRDQAVDRLHSARRAGVAMKETAAAKVCSVKQEVKQQLNAKIAEARPKVELARGRVSEQVSKLRASPMAMAGLAAGGGVAVGMLGRYLRYRTRYRMQTMPSIIIIGGAC